jgi:hypothetical protein
MGTLSCRLPVVVLYRTLNNVHDELFQLAARVFLAEYVWVT